MDNKDLVKKLIGKGLYDELRSRKAFNPLSHPFPMQKLEPVEIDWEDFSCSNSKSYTDFIYLISPTQRSGTNFLNHILDLHNQLKFPAGDNFPNEQCLYSSAYHLAEYIGETLTFWGKWVNSQRDISNYAREMMANMGESMLAVFTKELGNNQRLLLKTPDAGGLKFAPHLFPNARFVFLVRDGRDTIESFTKSWGGTGAFKKMSERWANRVDEMLMVIELMEAAGKGDQIQLVRYGDLVENPHDTLRYLLNKLDLSVDDFPWDELESTPVLGSSAFKKEGHVHWKPVEKTKDFNPLEKWVHWSEQQKDTFKNIAGTQLIRLGYATDMNW